tara:strand:- start:204 stop:488 length:285 start_codon:yes stop_codon:yes gene_type:complete
MMGGTAQSKWRQWPENVVDFTAEKIRRIIHEHEVAQDIAKAHAFSQALLMYLRGEIAIEWHDGQPYAIVGTTDQGAALAQAGVTEASDPNKPDS